MSTTPPDETSAVQLQAVLLAGGEGSRLGGVQKALIKYRGRSLLAHWCEALVSRGIETVVVGALELETHLSPDVTLTREEPPLAGPAAGVWAGVSVLMSAGAAGAARGSGKDEHPGRLADRQPEHVPDHQASAPNGGGYTLLLAVDTVKPDLLLAWLITEIDRAAARRPQQAVVPQDSSGKNQILASAVPSAGLCERVNSSSPAEAEGKPLRWLLDGFEATHPRLPSGLGRDVDTPDDAAALGVEL